jgi:monofunctional chorismate mutase
MNDDLTGIAAVRGAVPVRANTAADILEATARLLRALTDANALEPGRIVSALFTTTDDLDADFPAHAARRLGWTDVPMLHAREIPVPGAMPRVVRVLLTVRVAAGGARLHPIYLDEAAALRPDLTGPKTRAAGHRVAFVGLGQVGGSLARSLGAGWTRAGWDRSPDAVQDALRAGALDRAATSLADACADAEMAVVAVPVDALPSVLREVADALPAGAVLMDTGSARDGATEALAAAARRGLRAIGGHPLAGNEGHGFGSARAGAYRGHGFALLPVAHGVPPEVTAMLEALGSTAIVVDPAAHDRALARTSHLPYLVACALRDLGAAAAREGLVGTGFRDMTRLADSDGAVALAYCRANAREVTAAWLEARARLDEIVAELGA